MKWWAELPVKALVVWMIGIGLMAGLIGAYGRERHEGRTPSAQWWFTRVLLMPFLAMAASAAAEAFAFSPQRAGFIAALLALLGYDAIRLLTARVFGAKLLHITGLDDASGGQAVLRVVPGKEGGNLITIEVPEAIAGQDETPLHGGKHLAPETVPIEVVGPERSAGVGMALREVYQPVPTDMSDLLKSLEDPEAGH